MKIRDIVESSNTNILVVDIQPAYNTHCKHILPKVINLISKANNNVIVLYNGHGITDDTKDDVVLYYYEHGLDENILNNIQFVEKDYGFFRSWMDLVASDSTIIKIIRLLTQQRITDTRDLDNLPEILGDEYNDWMEYDPLILPPYVNVKMLKDISPFYMCGGGRNECLREIELLCNAFNIKYKRIDSLIY